MRTVAAPISSGAGGTSTQTQSRRWYLSSSLAVVFLLVTVSPLARHLGNGLRTAWALFPVWVLAALLERPGAVLMVVAEIKRRAFELTMLMAWVLVIFVNTLLGRGYAGPSHLQLMITLVMVVAMELIYSARRDNSYLPVARATIMLVGLDVLRSLPVLWANPHLARDITGGEVTGYYASQMAVYGVGEYNLYTGLAIALPVLAALLVSHVRGIRRKLTVVIIAAGLALAVILSMFMGAILLMVLGFSTVGLLLMVRSRNKARVLAWVLILGTIGLSVWWGYLQGSDQGSYFVSKFTDYYTSIVNGGLGTGASAFRTMLYKLSIDTFLTHPWIGIGPSSGVAGANYLTLIGGHSSWFDLPAEYGILGFGFYVLFLSASLRRAWRDSSENSVDILKAARVASSFALLVGGAYNPVVTNPEILVLFHFFVVGGVTVGRSSPSFGPAPRTERGRN